jgi:hypothetical protein
MYCSCCCVSCCISCCCNTSGCCSCCCITCCCFTCRFLFFGGSCLCCFISRQARSSMAFLVLWGNPVAAGCTHSACVSVSMCHSQHTHPAAHPACRRHTASVVHPPPPGLA